MKIQKHTHANTENLIFPVSKHKTNEFQYSCIQKRELVRNIQVSNDIEVFIFPGELP